MIEFIGTFTGHWYGGEHPSEPERLRLQVFSLENGDHRDATEVDLRAAGYVPVGEVEATGAP